MRFNIECVPDMIRFRWKLDHLRGRVELADCSLKSISIGLKYKFVFSIIIRLPKLRSMAASPACFDPIGKGLFSSASTNLFVSSQEKFFGMSRCIGTLYSHVPRCYSGGLILGTDFIFKKKNCLFLTRSFASRF